ncbi:MAG: hypothetical protein Q4C04_08585 [Clostridia bacterium]|nr:hypothetical protein [Clostridia bacterium]
MKSLQTVQKIMGVFRVLTLVAAICCFVGAAGALIGLASVAVASALSEPGFFNELMELMECNGLYEAIVGCIEGFVIALNQGVLLMMLHGYIKREREDGTPFTQRGAKELTKLGVLYIVMPIVAAIIVAVVGACFKVEPTELSNGHAVGFGITLLILSAVFRYGAELEAKLAEKQGA